MLNAIELERVRVKAGLYERENSWIDDNDIQIAARYIGAITPDDEYLVARENDVAVEIIRIVLRRGIPDERAIALRRGIVELEYRRTAPGPTAQTPVSSTNVDQRARDAAASAQREINNHEAANNPHGIPVGQINTNRAAIADNARDIATNAQRIEANRQAIANLPPQGATASQAAQIETNKTDIAANKGAIAANKTAIDNIDSDQIETNKTDISTNKAAIARNATAISEIDTDQIATNKADIATNKEAIAANKNRLDNLPDTTGSGATAAQVAKIEANDARSKANETKIAENATAIAENKKAIADLPDPSGSGATDAQVAKINANDTRSKANAAAIANNLTAINANKAAAAANKARLDNLPAPSASAAQIAKIDANDVRSRANAVAVANRALLYPVKLDFYPPVFRTNADLVGDHAVLMSQVREGLFTAFTGQDEINRIRIIERNTSTVVHDAAWQFSGNDWLIDFAISAQEAQNIALTGGDEFVEFRVEFRNRHGFALGSDWYAVPIGDEAPYPATQGQIDTLSENIANERATSLSGDVFVVRSIGTTTALSALINRGTSDQDANYWINITADFTLRIGNVDFNFKTDEVWQLAPHTSVPLRLRPAASGAVDQQARNDAAEAKTTAETAKSTADTAKSTADTAKSTADTAKSTADTAATAASNAASAAAVAKSAADDADTVARNARTVANANKAILDAQKFQIGLLDFNLDPAEILYQSGGEVAAFTKTFTMNVVGADLLKGDIWVQGLIAGIPIIARRKWAANISALNFVVNATNAGLIADNVQAADTTEAVLQFYDAASGGNLVRQVRRSIVVQQLPTPLTVTKVANEAAYNAITNKVGFYYVAKV